MKKLLVISILYSFFPFTGLYAQTKCAVLKPEISLTYDGQCRRGLANGKGIATGTDKYEGHFRKGLPDGEGVYTWATGEIYDGHWEDGKRNGDGEYTFSIGNRDSVIYGKWRDDRFISFVVRHPTVSSQVGVTRYLIQKTSNIRNRILINIYQNGTRNTGISSLSATSSSGYDTTQGPAIGFDDVKFPVKVKIRYTTFNNFRTSSYNVEFDFEIYESGDWKIDLDN